jgi:hypothetical protein
MHDANGTELKVGDKVLIPGEVISLSPGENYCNVTVRTTLGRRPDGDLTSFGSVNTAQLVKATESRAFIPLANNGGVLIR